MLSILIYEEALKDLIQRKEANNFNHILRARYFYIHLWTFYKTTTPFSLLHKSANSRLEEDFSGWVKIQSLFSRDASGEMDWQGRH